MKRSVRPSAWAFPFGELLSPPEERGIDIVMKAGTPNSLILKARKELFITDDVIKALDAKLPKVTIPPSAQ